METQILQQVQQALPQYKTWQVKAALDLLADGNTVPFIARYRKEATGTLDEVQIDEIQTVQHRVSEVFARQATIKKAIEEQGKLTPALAQQIEAATDLATLEDLYLPYKQKRRTKAQIAKEQADATS